MNKKLIIVAALAGAGIALFSNGDLRTKVLPSGVFSQDKPLDSSVLVSPEPIKGRPQVEITTSKGKFTLELRPDVAPKSVVNFLQKWNSGYCDNKTFHRVEDWVVQGCDPKGDGTGGETSLPTETSSLSFKSGVVGVARKNTPKDLSNDSQFFIVKKDSTFLDSEYTALGQVISGMDVINRLSVGDKIVSTTILSK